MIKIRQNRQQITTSGRLNEMDVIQECVVNIDGRIFDKLFVVIIAVCACISALMRYYRHTAYCLTLFLVYSFAVSLHCDFKATDYWVRYAVWTSIDLVFLFLVYSLVRAKIIKSIYFNYCALMEGIAISCHAMRMIDRTLTNYYFTDWFYSEAIWLTNFGFVMSAVVPTLIYAARSKRID